MALHFKPKRRRSFWLQLLFLLLLCYLAIGIVMGDRGLLSYVKATHENRVLKTDLEQALMEQKKLENKVNRMGANSLDLDLLDEQSRRVLGYSAENEVLVIEPEERLDMPTDVGSQN